MTTFTCPDMARAAERCGNAAATLEAACNVLEHDPNPTTLLSTLRTVIDQLRALERGDHMTHR